MGKFGVDPVISLALSIGAKPGSYALLLGSGLSRSAGIPTGWEVTLDLVRKVMVADGVGEDDSADPLEWYQERFDRDPDYSEVTGRLARSQTERRNLLREYFEPSALERQESKKVPAMAHKTIARQQPHWSGYSDPESGSMMACGKCATWPMFHNVTGRKLSGRG